MCEQISVREPPPRNSCTHHVMQSPVSRENESWPQHTCSSAAAMPQVGELHGDSALADGDSALADSGLSDDESLDLLFSIAYNAIKVADKTNSSTKNMMKTKRALEGFLTSVSSSRPKGSLAMPNYFLTETDNLLINTSRQHWSSLQCDVFQ